MERRIFLSAVTSSSVGVLFDGSLSHLARSQSNAQPGTNLAGEIPFEASQVNVSGNTVFVRRYGKGPAILLVHGFPRTSLMWRFLASKLAESHSVMCVDLRAYGRSGISGSTDDHCPYSKRAIAEELVGVMDKLGFPTFTLIGHDRGGRVSYRMALDHSKNVERLAVFDVIPIFEAWSREVSKRKD
jgi:haloacetate dehalogenase